MLGFYMYPPVFGQYMSQPLSPIFPISSMSQQETKPYPETQSIPETLPDTRQTSSSGRDRRKQPEEAQATKTQENWTSKEELALARAWVDIFEDHVVGNDQEAPVFIGRIHGRKKFVAMKRGL
ncbi:hypothetical protein Hanom_Chr00s000002g01600481 [Helianthus anomalus]